jgi:8-oxo-dGTP diphosphatase
MATATGADSSILRAEVCVGAVAVERDHLLMIRRGRGAAAGQWSIPGGRVEFGETLASAVVREVFEETGLEVVADSYLGLVERIDGEHHFVIHDFLVTVMDRNTRPVAGDDAAEAEWVPFEDITERHVVDGLIEFLVEHNVLHLIP